MCLESLTPLVQVGGVHITPSSTVCLHESGISCNQSRVSTINHPSDTLEENIIIDDDDFVATFDCKLRQWIVRWKSAAKPPVYLQNIVGQYKIAAAEKDAFDAEVGQWIADGYLQLYNGGPRNIKGIIPLMSVVQRNKNKVRPVLDYRELNTFACSYTGDAVVCVKNHRDRKSVV